MSPSRVTLVDVARHAGVSRATASLVLRGSTLVAAETRERVQASMRELGYVYHRAAATLRSKRSHLVGLVIPDITNPFYAEMTVGVEQYLEEQANVVVLGNTGESLERQQRLLEAMHENNADGVLLCPAEGTPRSVLDALTRWQLPTVLLVRYLFDIEADYVGTDNQRGAEEAVDHLVAHGHRRIAFVGGYPSSSARRDRMRGFRAALARHGLCIDEGLLPTCPPTRAGGQQAMQSLLALREAPTAVLCYNDVVAFGVLLALQQLGLTPGRDMAVIGFDNIADAALWHPPLSTVAIAPRQVGQEAARLLLQRIEIPDRAPQQVVLTPHLIVRATCGAHGEEETGR